MKTFYSTIFCALFLASCTLNKADFSCDPVLNEYVSSHQEALAQLTLSDLVTSDLVYQQAVFRSYDPAKKREIWMQKIQFLLTNEKYSEAEFIHVKSLLDHLNENYFTTENLEVEAGKRFQFKTDWINHAKNGLGWTNRYIAFVVYSLYTTQDQFDLELNALNSTPTQDKVNPGPGSCSCDTSASFCDTGCRPGNCQPTTGCGWLWSGSCDGVCQQI